MIQRVLIYGALAGGLLLAVFLFGYSRGEMKLFEYIAEQAAARVVVIQKQGEVSERVVTRYIKVKGETQTVTNSIEREVIRYENPGYCLDAAWGRLHDAAASNSVPGSSGGADVPERAPTAAGSIETVTANYAACHRTADRLDALQGWVMEQRKVTQ